MADRDLELRLIIRADGSAAIRNIKQVDEAVDDLGESAQQAGGRVRDMGNQANATGGVLSRMLGVLRSFAGPIVSAFSVVGIALFLKKLVETDLAMAEVRKSLEDVTGSAESAQQKFDELQALAESSKFTIDELSASYADLRRFGLIPTQDIMLALTNSAAKSDDASKALADTTEILGKAWANGKLQGEDLLRLINLNVPALDLMAKATGKSSDQILEMAKKGQLGREAISKLIVEMQKFASGENTKSIDTIRGSFDQLSKTWDRFLDNLAGPKTEAAIKTVSGWIKGLVSSFTGVVGFLDEKINGANAELVAVSETYKKIAEQKQKIAAIKAGNPVADVVNAFVGTDLAKEENRLDALYKELSDRIIARSKSLDQARLEANKDADANKKNAASQNPPGTTTPTGGRSSGRNAALDDARQIADAEVQIELDRITRIEQLADAEFQNDIARAEAQAREKLAKAGGDAQAQLAIEQELADRKNEIERNQLEASRSFAEEKLRVQLAAKQRERDSTNDLGEQARINADIVRIEQEIAQARDLSGLAAEQLAADETASAAERARAAQGLVDRVIDKYDQLAAKRRELDADAAIISKSNLSLERKAELLDLIAKGYDEAGDSAQTAEEGMSAFAEQGARNMQDVFADFLFDPFKDGIDGMLRGFVDVLRRMAAEALSAQIFDLLLGKQGKEGGRAGGLLGGVVDLFSSDGAGEVAQVTANEAAKNAAVAAGESARATIVGAAAAKKAVAVAAGQAGETNAVVAGETARKTAETSGQATSLATTLVTTAKKIHAFAASAAAAAYDAMASIPYIGPVLGAAAAAATYAAVLAFGALTGGAAFAAGGRTDATPGGRQRGPGTSTSDSIPAWLSNNEHVIKEQSVQRLDQKYGRGFLDYLNENGELPASVRALSANKLIAPQIDMPIIKFNAGGRVNGPAPGGREAQSSRNNSADRLPVSIVNVIDPSLIHDAMSGSSGTRIIMNALTNNPRAARQALEI